MKSQDHSLCARSPACDCDNEVIQQRRHRPVVKIGKSFLISFGATQKQGGKPLVCHGCIELEFDHVIELRNLGFEVGIQPHQDVSETQGVN
jgi:hypothetical protein